MPDGEKFQLSDRMVLGFSAMTRWAMRDTGGSHAADGTRRGRANPLGIVKGAFFVTFIILCPLFVLPIIFVRFAQTGLTGLRYGASVDVVGGDAARWESGTLPPAAPVAEIRAGLAAIATRDQGFRVRALTGWAAGVTALLCRSMVTGDATWARTFMANGLYRAHQALLELRDGSHVSCQGSWQAVDANVIGASRSALVEEVRVRVTCQGWRQERHQPTGLPLRGGPDAGTWSEDLTFARAADALTPPVGGLPASRCPSCGAALDLDPAGACRYCKGIVTAGRHDWVLVSWQRAPW
jgi:hypothetical protein